MSITPMSDQNPNGDAKAIEWTDTDGTWLTLALANDPECKLVLGRATPADLAAAIKAMPSAARTLLLIDVVEDSSALGQVRAELEAVRLELQQMYAAFQGSSHSPKNPREAAQAVEQVSGDGHEQAGLELARELAEVRLELEQQMSRAEDWKTNYLTEKQRLTTERARTEEAERQLVNTRDNLLSLLAAANARAARLGEENTKLRDAVNIDRTGLAAGLNHLKAIASGYRWIPDGEWGSYDYTQRSEATLREEVGRLIDGIASGADRYLKASGERATAALSAAPQASTEPHCSSCRGACRLRGHLGHHPAQGSSLSPQASTEQCYHQVGTLGHCVRCGARPYDNPITQAPTEQVECQERVTYPNGRFRQCELPPGHDGVHMLGLSRDPSPIPQVAQASALPWDQPRTTSAELAGGDPFAKAPSQQSDADAAVASFRAQLVAALRLEPDVDPEGHALPAGRFMRGVANRLEGGK
jgi:hypothetical protein